MIIDDFIEVIINPKMYKFYESLGYIINKGEKTKIKIDDLSKGSVYKIKCRCDVCNMDLVMEYRQYIKGISSCNFYSCKKCCYLKNEIFNIKKYGTKMPLNDPNSDMYSKRMKSMLDKYGFEYCWQNKMKYQELFLNKFGVTNISKLEFVKEKKKMKSLNKYGTENVFQSEEIKSKIKETNLIKYGVQYPSQSPEIREKSKQTSIKNFGYEYAMQNPDYFNKRQKKLFQKLFNSDLNLFYQGSYELDFIDYCINNHIEIENGPSINYILNDKKRVYHSDFYIKNYNLICEIKSSYTFQDDYEENLAKRDYSIRSGYNFIFIIDKRYDALKKIMQENEKEN